MLQENRRSGIIYALTSMKMFFELLRKPILLIESKTIIMIELGAI